MGVSLSVQFAVVQQAESNCNTAEVVQLVGGAGHAAAVHRARRPVGEWLLRLAIDLQRQSPSDRRMWKIESLSDWQPYDSRLTHPLVQKVG